MIKILTAKSRGNESKKLDLPEFNDIDIYGDLLESFYCKIITKNKNSILRKSYCSW